MHQCPYCSEKVEHIDFLISNIKKFHLSAPNLKLPCGRPGCPKVFKSFGSRFTHISRDHKRFYSFENGNFDMDTDDTNVEYQSVSDFRSSQDEMEIECDDFIDEIFIPDNEIDESNLIKRELAEAQFILNLRSQGVSQALITTIIDKTETLVRSCLEEYHGHINKALSENGIVLENIVEVPEIL